MDSHFSGANTLCDIALPTNTATDIGKQECFQGLIHTCLREGICASGSVDASAERQLRSDPTGGGRTELFASRACHCKDWIRPRAKKCNAGYRTQQLPTGSDHESLSSTRRGVYRLKAAYDLRQQQAYCNEPASPLQASDSN